MRQFVACVFALFVFLKPGLGAAFAPTAVEVTPPTVDADDPLVEISIDGPLIRLSGVNVTVGLPFLRVSVDHGTAFDRAWKGVASHESMVEALDIATTMLHVRSHRPKAED